MKATVYPLHFPRFNVNDSITISNYSISSGNMTVRSNARIHNISPVAVDDEAYITAYRIVYPPSSGICNLTVRNSAKGIKTLRYNNREFAASTKTTIGNSLESFRKKIHFATITPASLEKYYNTSNQNNQVPPSGLFSRQI